MKVYRFFEIVPGALAWLTLFLMFFLSWKLPAAVAVFIILFDIYWLLKTIYLSLHLRSTFSLMKANLKVDWLSRLQELPPTTYGSTVLSGSPSKDYSLPTTYQDIYHLVIFPMYKEPHEIVRESFLCLLRANFPKDKFMVVLSVEEKGGSEAKMVGEKIKREFGDKFFKFLLTIHPAGSPGEIPGKGANEAWAAKEAKRLIIDPLVNSQTYADIFFLRQSALSPRESAYSPRESALSRRESALRYENILVSVFDVDTQVFPEYFGRLTYVFLTSPERERAIYQPIPFFTNNVYKAPAVARVVSFSATFWQMMQQSRPERLTSFSSQSIPFRTLCDIGFWQKNIVSEDSRIFWQCYLRYHGDFRVEPLFYPVSMDANVAPTLWRTLGNIYRQQRRWGWGAENIPYLLDGFRRDPRIPKRKKWYWSFNVIEGFHSWATNSLIIFALGWLPVILGGRHFNYTLLSYGLPQITRFIVSLAMIGIASSAVLGILLLPPRPEWFRARHYLIYFFQWLLIPLTLIVFGALPGLEAQTRLMLGGRWRLGFWVTPKGRYPESERGSGESARVPPLG